LKKRERERRKDRKRLISREEYEVANTFLSGLLLR
jgi:hypothetical protein